MKRLACLLSAVLLYSGSLANPSPYAFRHYSTKDGLSSNSVRALLQDRKGLIWIGTSDGLDSFDGREVIHHAIPGENSIYVQALLEDASGTLWVGTDDAVYRYGPEGLMRLEGLDNVVVNDLKEYPAGTLWVATYGKGLWRWENGTLTPFLEGHNIEKLHVAANGRLWVADSSLEGGLCLFNESSGQFVSPGLTYIDCAPTRVCAIGEDSYGDIWLGTWDQGLYRIDASLNVHLAAAPGEGLTHVHTLTHDPLGHILSGADDGLLHLNPVSGERILYLNDRKDPASLSNKFVYPILADHEGGIWVGTYYGGLNYVPPQVGQFVLHSLSDMAGKSEDLIISCLSEDSDGMLWVGSDNGGLFRYHPVQQTVTRLSLPAPWGQRLASYNIHALLRWKDQLWVGTYSSNLLCINLSTRSVKEYGRDQGLNASSIYTLTLSEDGTLWAGTYSGIFRYDAAADRFVLEKEASWVTACEASADGTLWFASARGGILERSRRGVWQAYTTQNGGLPTNYVNCLMATPSGLYAGTQKGLVLLSGGKTSVLLEGIDVQDIAYDGRHLWLASQATIIRYSTADGKTEEFGPNDGVQAKLFTPNASLVARDGRIYMGSADGMVSFYPGSIRGNGIPPTVLLTRFLASGPDSFQDVLHSQDLSHVKLSWRYRDLNISFAAPSYWAPEKVQYACLLEGMDREWREIGKQNSLTLSKLPAGHYRLLVKACNNSGVWGEPAELTRFTLREHPLRSNLALTLYTTLALLLVWLLLHWRVRRTERKSSLRYAEELDAALTRVKEEERDDRLQLLSSLREQLEAPITGIGLQLEKVKGQQKALGPIREELSVLEKNHRMLRNISGNLRQMHASLVRRQAGPLSPAPATPDEAFLERLDALINQHMANADLSVEFLSQEMAISRSGLFAKTKALTGETPNNLINQARLNAAANLLAEGRHSVGEICYMTGFSSPSYFSKIFVRQFGVPPHEWAAKSRE